MCSHEDRSVRPSRFTGINHLKIGTLRSILPDIDMSPADFAKIIHE